MYELKILTTTPVVSGREKWWEKRTNFERKLIRILVVAGITAFCITIILLISLLAAHKKHATCTTLGCVTTASTLYKTMDVDVDPCEDFYRFACGNYLKTTSIPEDKTYVNTFTKINDLVQEQLKSALDEPIGHFEQEHFQVAKKFYKSCLDKERIDTVSLETAKKLLESVGNWPVLSDFKDDDFKWYDTVYYLRKAGMEYNSLFEVSVSLDWKNTSKWIIEIDQPSFGLKTEYLKMSFWSKIIQGYYEYMVDVAVIFGADGAAAKDQLKQSLLFEMTLANHSMAQEERRNVTNMYNVMKIHQLEYVFVGIPWYSYLVRLFPQDLDITPTEEVLVVAPTYIAKLEDLLKTVPKRVLANYLMWRAVSALIPYLGEELRQRELKFTHLLNGVEKTTTRWKECIEETQSRMPILTGALYIRKYFHKDSKRHALELVHYIKEAFMSNLKELEWMEEETRQSALEKAEAMSQHVAYPDEILDDKKLAKLYAPLHVHENEYLLSALNISLFRSTLTLERLRQAVNKSNWMDHADAAEVNAYYHPLENSIIFPAGILQGNLFHKDRPRYMNFGAIGSVIGHEITHGFDDQGRQFDKNGNLIDWWQPCTRSSFLAKAKCIVEQYNNYTILDLKLSLNGLKTQGENIADNGGVKQAYLAYRKWVNSHGEEAGLPGINYTPNQLFWVSAAQNWCSKHRLEDIEMQVTTDEHAPEEFRVIGPFSNLDQFSEDYRCRKGSKMNPEKKCSVW